MRASLVVDVDGFWELIEGTRQFATRRELLAWLEDELIRRPVEEIVDYHVLWKTVQSRGCTWDLYMAYGAVFASGSLDGFEYFVDWLISLGREPYELVTDCPDLLIELPAVLHVLELRDSYYRNPALWERRTEVWTDDERPAFELLSYVSMTALEKATGRDVNELFEAVRGRDVPGGFPLIPALGSDFHGEKWDEEEFARRLPRIAGWLASGSGRRT